MKAEERKTILLVGGRHLTVAQIRPFTLKGLYLVSCDLSTLNENTAPGIFANAKGILVAEPSGKYGTLSEVFNRIAGLATGEGLALTYLPCEPSDIKRASGLMAQTPFLELVEKGKQWVYLQHDVDVLAESLRGHDPGPGSGRANVVMLGEEFILPADHRQLLLRAFWDASDIAIEKLSGGASAPGAYRVYASLCNRNGRQEPTPFVFKVDRPFKIREECNNYREFVQPFVPFHLRPGLIESRCVETPHLAALACNFVEGAVPLETALSNGHGAGVIFSLFETTLRGFRHQTLSSVMQPNVLNLFVKTRVKIAQLRTDTLKLPRIAQAKKLGFSGEPEELENSISQRAEGMESLHGVVHGDLHMGNV
ncbi:MAG: hypothetical protein JWN25_3012, partial [Verrucomicrobiales bacterium]|nr:hypothetical protein [Verrucomicrobiales bacterium]